MSCLKILFQNRSKKKFFCCDLWVAEERNKSKKKRRVFLLAKRQNLKKEEFLVLGFSWLFVSRILFRRRGFQPKIKSVFVLGQKCLTISTKIISKADRNNEKKETTKRNNICPNYPSSQDCFSCCIGLKQLTIFWKRENVLAISTKRSNYGYGSSFPPFVLKRHLTI